MVSEDSDTFHAEQCLVPLHAPVLLFLTLIN